MLCGFGEGGEGPARTMGVFGGLSMGVLELTLCGLVAMGLGSDLQLDHGSSRQTTARKFPILSILGRQ